MYIHTRSRINRQSSIHPRPFARSRVSHHPRRASTMPVAIIIVAASSPRRLVASSRRIVAPKFAPAPPWRITIRSNKTSHDAMRCDDASRNGATCHTCSPKKVCSMGHPSIHVVDRECATRGTKTMTTPMEMFQAMQAKLRESSREYETIAEGARTTSDDARRWRRRRERMLVGRE